MPKRIENLTPAQTERMESFAREWIERGWRTAPLTEEEWAVQNEGMRRCYEYAGIPFPKTIIRISSPLVGAFAAPIAALTIARVRSTGAVGGAVDDAVRGAVRVAVRGAVDGAVRGAVGDAVGGAVGDAVGDAVDGAVRGAVGGAVGDAVRGAVDDAVRGAVGGAVGDAVRGAVGGAVGDAVGGAVGGAVGDAVDDAVGGAVGGAVGDAVRGAVGGAVGDAVRGAVGGAVRGAVDDAVRGAVGDAVGDAVDGAVRVAVGDAVRGAVRGAVDEREMLDFIRNNFHKALGGRTGGYWSYTGPWWESYVGYFRDIAELELPGDLWDRSRALEDADSAGWWWPFREFVMVCDVPTTMLLERVGPQGWNSHRLHCETGPAIAWSDGFGLYYWHGVKVPAWVIENPTVDQAMRETNSEIRRAAFESIGWDKAIGDLGLVPIGSCPDPGNDPHELTLYSLPEQIYDEPVNLLLMVNGSPDRDGNQRMYGETVPASIKHPLAAAAWQYGVPTDVYAQLARRS